MKNKKFLALAVSAMALASVCVFAACTPGSTPEDNKTGKTEYIMEAEYIDLDNVSGAGISSNQAGLQMIYGDGTQAQKDLGWSNGYYVGFTHTAECVLTFTFNADKADDSAMIVFRLGSELGDITITPKDVAIKVNGESIQYGSFSINGSAGEMSTIKFKDYTVSSKASIVAGKNTVTLEVQQNSLRGQNSTGGPMVDCLKITTASKLTYTENTNNPIARDEI